MNHDVGKVAVITGAGRGLGRGIAIECANRGMKTVLAGIREESLNQTAKDLTEMGAETLIVQTDVSIASDVTRLADISFSTFGEVHLLVNNAGAQAPATALESSLSDWEWIMGVNFYGVLYGIQAFVPRMLEQTSKSRVVNVSSLAGVVEASGPYSVSKHAVGALSEAIYHDLMDKGEHVRISVYCPGAMNTEFYRIGNARSERFKENETVASPERQESSKQFYETYGFSIKDAVDTLFTGIEEDKLYIGPLAYKRQFPDILDVIKRRADNITAEINPSHPWSAGPVNPIQ